MDIDEIVRRAVGFDLAAELELCREMVTAGGPGWAKEVFDHDRATRLFQGLLSTGRVFDLEPHWQQSVAAAVEQGTLAPPEWN